EYSTGNQFSVPYSINGTTIAYSIPLSFIGNDDGEMDIVALSGTDLGGPFDWAPDEGHATLYADAFWLSENPTFGTVPPGGNITVEISLNTAELIGGNYYAAIDVNSNDPLNAFIEIPVTLNLTGIPQISVSTATLNFGETYLGYHNSLFFTISSVGTDSLIGNITSDNPEFIVLDSSFVLPVGEVKIIEVQFHPADTGLSIAELLINSNAQFPLTVFCMGQGVIAPNIITSNFPFHFAAQVGDTLTGSFNIYNNGGADLVVEISDEETSNPSERFSDRLFGVALSVIYEIDPNSGDILNSFSTPVTSFGGPIGLAFSGEYLYFTDAVATPYIYVLDAETGSVITSYPTPSFDIDGLAFIEPNLYAMDYSFSTIYVLDSQTGSIINTIYPPAPVGGGIDGGNGRLFASDFNMNIYELNPVTGAIINSFSSVNFVYGLGFTGERLFAADGFSTIDEYDPDTGNFVGSFSSNDYWALAGGGDPDAEWLTENPNFVTVPGGDSIQISITIIPIADGHFTAYIILDSNDPDSLQVRIPVVLDVVTGIEDEINLPTIYALYQNYPNPFNPTTQFSYDLPEQSNVLLKIYNILGEEVATLINETQNPGRFNIVWDASHLASGIYLYRFIAGNFVETKKMILLK
ncbi:MAG: choice-of-anchor D domain-containing protein, partial [Ignavibacteria bacterium]|nr:choice-of-anchor D domain-containing protein [Ignavibacteria bacterium]